MLNKLCSVYANIQSKGLVLLLSVYGAVQFISLFQRILLARLLTEQNFGRISLLQEGITAFANFATLAIPLALVRFSLINKEFKAYGWLSLKIIGAMNIILFSIYYSVRFFSPFLNDIQTQAILDYMIPIAPAITLYVFADHFLTVQKLVREKALLLLTYRTLVFVLISTGVVLYNFKGVVTAIIIGNILLVGLVSWKISPLLKGSFESKPLKPFVQFVAYENIFFLAIYSQRALIFFLTEILITDLKEVAYVSVAFSIAVFIAFTYNGINETYLPYLMDRKNYTECKKYFWKINGLNILFSLIILGSSLFIIPFFIPLLFGEVYVKAVPVFKIVCFGEVLMGLALIYEGVLRILHVLKIRAVGSTIFLSAFVVSMFFLVPSYGAIGTAISFLVGCMVRLILSVGLLTIYFRENRFLEVHQ